MPRRTKIDPAKLKSWLDDLFLRYHRPKFMGSDPLLHVHRYGEPRDQEIVGLIAASLAYGNVKTINASIEKVLAKMGNAPRAFLDASSANDIRANLKGFRHRWTNEVSMASLLVGIKQANQKHGSLEAAFMSVDQPDGDIMTGLARWVGLVSDGSRKHAKPLLSNPTGGSACKRLHLYLRWMARRDEIDPGCWRGVSPSRLLMPVDTHIHQFALMTGFTRSRAANHRTVEEITNRFRELCPADPLRYDFALTRFGMLEGWGAASHLFG